MLSWRGRTIQEGWLADGEGRRDRDETRADRDESHGCIVYDTVLLIFEGADAGIMHMIRLLNVNVNVVVIQSRRRLRVSCRGRQITSERANEGGGG